MMTTVPKPSLNSIFPILKIQFTLKPPIVFQMDPDTYNAWILQNRQSIVLCHIQYLQLYDPCPSHIHAMSLSYPCRLWHHSQTLVEIMYGLT